MNQELQTRLSLYLSLDKVAHFYEIWHEKDPQTIEEIKQLAQRHDQVPELSDRLLYRLSFGTAGIFSFMNK